MSSELELQLKRVEATLVNDPQNQELLQLKTELEEVIKLESEVKNNKESEQEEFCANSRLKLDNRSQSKSVDAEEPEKERTPGTIRDELIRNAVHIREVEPIPSEAPIIEINATSISVVRERKVTTVFNRRIPQWVQRFVLANYILENPNCADWPPFINVSLRALNAKEKIGKSGVSVLLIGKNGQQVRVLIPLLAVYNIPKITNYEFVVPPSKVKILIGPPQTFLMSVEYYTKALVDIQKTNRKKVCTLAGTQSEIDKALAKIKHEFQKETVEPDYGPLPDGSSVYEFPFSRDFLNRFVGKNKKTFLKEISQRTEAVVGISLRFTTLHERTCFLKGTIIQIENALKMIRDKFPQGEFPQLGLDRGHYIDLKSTRDLDCPDPAENDL